MSALRWSVLKKGNDGHKAEETCLVCKGACVPKDIGNICVTCIDKIPKHIPLEQTRKYLSKKRLKIKND